MQLDTQQLDAWAVKRAAETLQMTETRPDELAATAVVILQMTAKKLGELDAWAVNAQNVLPQPKPNQASSAPLACTFLNEPTAKWVV
jgi:hypothetical protein